MHNSPNTKGKITSQIEDNVTSIVPVEGKVVFKRKKANLANSKSRTDRTLAEKLNYSLFILS